MTRRREEWPRHIHARAEQSPARRFVWYPEDLTIRREQLRSDPMDGGPGGWSGGDIPWADQSPIIPVSLEVCWRCDEVRIPREDPIGLCPACAEHLQNLTSPAGQIETPEAENLDLTAYWVCLDCFFAHHYGAEQRPAPTGVLHWYVGPDFDDPLGWREPLGLLPHGADVFDWSNSETGEGIDDFVWALCEGCGTPLGGTRYRLGIRDPHAVTPPHP